MTVTEKIFIRYEELAISYANKIWNENKLALEKEDLYQEMRIKLFLAIKAYSKRWKEYRQENSKKPIPLEFYLRTAMANKVRDFISDINSAMDKGDTINFDKGVLSNEITYLEDDINISGDLMSNLFETIQEKRIFRILLRHDFNRREVSKHLIIESEEELVESCLEKIKVYLQTQGAEYQEFFINEVFED